MKVKNKFKSLLSILIPILLFLTLFEISLRFAHFLKKEWQKHKQKTSLIEICPAYEKPGRTPDTFDKIAEMEYSTYLGYIAKSNYRGIGYTTNNMHFRYSEDFPFKKQENEFRVFITGGSTAWGTGVPQEETFANIAESLIRRDYANRSIKVVSAGMGAYASTQERILIENWLLNFSPDLIIMFSGWNDSYFGFVGEDILVKQDFMGYQDRLEGKTKIKRSTPEFEKYFSKMHYFIDKALYSASHDDEAMVRKAIIEQQDPVDTVVSDLLRNIHIISDLSKRYNFKLVFVLQPSLFSTQKKLSEYEQKVLKEYTNRQNIGFAEYNNEVYGRLRKLLPLDAQENDYQFHDADMFISSTEESLFYDYVHFGDRGNRILAEEIYKIIKNHM